MDKKRGSAGLLVFVTVLLTLVTAAGGLTAYIKLADKIVVDRKGYEEISGKLDKYGKLIEIDDTIADEYLFDYNEEGIMESAYRSMLASLGDEYTRYLDEDELAELRDSVNSTFTGTGIVFRQSDDGFVITEIITGGPADAAGLKVGDIITGVDGKEYTDQQQLRDALKGDAGSTVRITYKRGDETMDVNVVRGEIVDASMESGIIDSKIGYVRIKSFGKETYSDFDKAIRDFEKAGIRKLIIDLRSNPGGLFETGIKIADRILPKCLITYTEDKNGVREDYNSDDECIDMDVVVIVNEKTASTAEVLTAAIADNGAGKVIGMPTYGKGIVQKMYEYDDGSAVNITTKQYFSPNGRTINKTGIIPDESVEQSADAAEDVQLARAKAILGD